MTSNKELDIAYQLIETTGANLFLTGKAGTGKTTFLKYLRENSSKCIVVLAPTGIAAINAGGMTVHSFFQLSFSPFIPGIGQAAEGRMFRWSKEKRRVIRTMDLLVIDEVSMVRADMLDAIDSVLRRMRNPSLPFGGVQLLLIGDLGQLSPVVRDEEWSLLSAHYDSPYFFDSIALRQSGYETIMLDKVYRQHENDYLEILNRIRDNRVDSEILDSLNRRVCRVLNPLSSEHAIRLVALNRQADEINRSCFNALKSEIHTFKADVKGDFPKSSYPVAEDLQLRIGSQVMFVKNDLSGSKRYYNGMIGEITGFGPSNTVIVNCADGSGEVSVGYESWQNMRYTVNPHTNRLEEICIGEFSQIPLRLAWAITIHKSQGLTFDRAHIDTSSAFAHGQTYVALSRCRTLGGLTLETPVSAHDIISDRKVEEYRSSHINQTPDKEKITSLQKRYVASVLSELFDFLPLLRAMQSLERLSDEFFTSVYPQLASKISETIPGINTDLIEVSAKFAVKYGSLIESSQDGCEMPDIFNLRLKDAARYFYEKLQEIRKVVNKIPVELDNARALTRLKNILAEVKEIIFVKINLFSHIEVDGFMISDYLHHKTDLLLQLDGKPKDRTKTRRKTVRNSTRLEADDTVGENDAEAGTRIPKLNAEDITDDIRNIELFNALRRWRAEKAHIQKRPAYMVAQTKTLIAIANISPDSESVLTLIPGVGKRFIENYSHEVLDIISRHR